MKYVDIHKGQITYIKHEDEMMIHLLMFIKFCREMYLTVLSGVKMYMYVLFT